MVSIAPGLRSHHLGHELCQREEMAGGLNRPRGGEVGGGSEDSSSWEERRAGVRGISPEERGEDCPRPSSTATGDSKEEWQ